MEKNTFGTNALLKSGFHSGDILTTAQAARVLSIRLSTLANWRCAKRYDLHYLKVGSRIYYPADALIAFLDKQTR